MGVLDVVEAAFDVADWFINKDEREKKRVKEEMARRRAEEEKERERQRLIREREELLQSMTPQQRAIFEKMELVEGQIKQENQNLKSSIFDLQGMVDKQSGEIDDLRREVSNLGS